MRRGLPVSDGRKAIESVKPNFISEKIDSQTYWFRNSFPSKPVKDAVYLLPAFDEFIISYKDRSACLPFLENRKAISNNGIFHPVIVANGQVIGLWKRTMVKNRPTIETQFFSSKTARDNKDLKKSIAEAAARVSNFYHPS